MNPLHNLPARRQAPPPRDRASVVATSLLAIFADYVRNDAGLYDMLVAILRDELADIKQQAISEIRLSNDG